MENATKPKDDRKIIFDKCSGAVKRAAESLEDGYKRLGWHKHTLQITWVPKCGKRPTGCNHTSDLSSLISQEAWILRDYILPISDTTRKWFESATAMDLMKECLAPGSEINKALLLWRRFGFKFRYVDQNIVLLNHNRDVVAPFEGSLVCDPEQFFAELSVELARLEHVERRYQRLLIVIFA